MNTAIVAPSASARWRQFHRQLRKLDGRPLRFTVEVRAAFDALFDDSIGPHAFELLTACAHSAMIGGERECFGCRRPWILEDRIVVAMGYVVVLDLENTADLFGLSSNCWATPNPTALMAEAFKRDFGLASLTVQTMPQGGRA